MKKLLFTLCLLVLLFALAIDQNAQAQIPRLVNYQAFLVSDFGVPVEGAQSITFKIYDRESGGSALWVEVQNVSVTRGLLNVYLGTVEALDIEFDKPYWLEISLGTTIFSRSKLSSSPYSYTALKADTSKFANNVPDSIITQAKIASGVRTEPMGSAGGDLSGTYPDPTIKDSILTLRKFAPGTVFIPSGSAGGDLTGAYPNPRVGVGMIDNSKLAEGAVTQDKIASAREIHSGLPLVADNNNSASFTQLTGKGILNKAILDKHIADTAAISGYKIYPIFGNQRLEVGTDPNKIVLNPSNGSVTANSFVGAYSGNANTATAIRDGASGEMLYQLSPSSTTFVPLGTNGQFLKLNTGIPAWNNITFADIQTGTNTSTLTVNGLLSPGTGVVVANKFIGTGSSTDAVDLNTAEVAGVLTRDKLPGNIAYRDSMNTFTTFNLFAGATQLNGLVTGINTTESASSATGAITTLGGVGIAKNLNVGGTLQVQSGVAITKFSNDGTLGANSDFFVPTERAVRNYVDNETMTDSLALRALINTNTANIATNTADIMENTEDINKLMDSIKYTRKVRDSIGVHRTEIDAIKDVNNTQNTNIATNTSNIATNTANIATNTSDIVKVKDSIGVHRTEISAIKVVDNTQNGNIATLQGNISTLNGSVASHSNLLNATPGVATANKAVILDIGKALTGMGDLSMDGILYISNTTNSTLVSNGAVVIDGGVGVALDLNVGGSIRLGNTTTDISGTIRYTDGDFQGYNGTEWQSFTSSIPGWDLIEGRLLPVSLVNNISISQPTTFTGDLDIQGVITNSATSGSFTPIPVTIDDDLYVNGAMQLSGSLTPTSGTLTILGAVDVTSSTDLALSIADGGGAVKLSYGTAVAGAMTIPDDVSVFVFTEGTAGVVILPTPITGKILYLKNLDAADLVTLKGAKSGIDYDLTTKQGITLIGDGTNWHIVGISTF